MAVYRFVRTPPESRVQRVRRGEVGPWLEDEIRDYAGSVLLEAHQEQRSGGQAPPVAREIVIDERIIAELKPNDQRLLQRIAPAQFTIDGFQNQVAFNYAEFQVLAEAVFWAMQRMNQLLRRGPYSTGKSKRGMYVVCMDTRNRDVREFDWGDIISIRNWLYQPERSTLASVRLTGPIEPYRRGVIYNPPSGSWSNAWRNTGIRSRSFRAGDRSLIRQRLQNASLKPAIHDRVGRAVQRRFGRGLWVGYGFTRAHSSKLPLPKYPATWKTRGNLHVPQLYLGMTAVRPGGRLGRAFR